MRRVVRGLVSGIMVLPSDSYPDVRNRGTSDSHSAAMTAAYEDEQPGPSTTMRTKLRAHLNRCMDAWIGQEVADLRFPW
jgi:hypothetical protein